MENMVSISDVARILSIIDDPPNPREKPLSGDLEGRFSQWFDGGAVRNDTGVNYYQFLDGTEAFLGIRRRLSLLICFPNGVRIRIYDEEDSRLAG